MTSAAAPVFGIVGALAAFPRRLAAREVARHGGTLRRGVTRSTSHVVFGRSLLSKPDAEIAARVDGARRPGRQLMSENGLLRRLGLLGAAETAALSRQALLDQSGLAARDFELLGLFDAFECDTEPFAFRDLILARKYAGLMAGGTGWGAIARSAHRAGAVAALTAQSLRAGRRGAIYARAAGGPCELDGQLRLDLGQPADDELEAFFATAEAAEAAGRHAEAAHWYHRCLAIDPADPVAAFNRANCLRAAGRQLEAAHDYARALKLDPRFVEAWFNLAALMTDRGRPEAARRYLERAVTLDAGYADAVYNLASLEFDAGNLERARRWWERYLELDPESDWARTAERGIRFVGLKARNDIAG